MPSASRVVLVVPPQAALTASGEMRQVLSVRAGGPLGTVDAIAERGLPVPVGSAVNVRLAAELRDRLRRDHGLEARLVEPGGGAWLGALVAAVGGAGAALLVSLALWVLGATLVAGGLLALAMALGVAAVLAWGRYDADRTASHQVNEAVQLLDAANDAAPDAVRWLLALRSASLEEELPPHARGDLWAALDEVEEQVLTGDESALQELSAAAASLLEGEAPPDVGGRLARAAAAAQAARAEIIGRPG